MPTPDSFSIPTPPPVHFLSRNSFYRPLLKNNFSTSTHARFPLSLICASLSLTLPCVLALLPFFSQQQQQKQQKPPDAKRVTLNIHIDKKKQTNSKCELITQTQRRLISRVLEPGFFLCPACLTVFFAVRTFFSPEIRARVAQTRRCFERFFIPMEQKRYGKHDKHKQQKLQVQRIGKVLAASRLAKPSEQVASCSVEAQALFPMSRSSRMSLYFLQTAFLRFL